MTHPILAIDHGDARIGLAATDEFGIGTHPVETIDCQKTEIIPRILEIIAERKIQAVVLGLPLRSDGSEGNSSAKVRQFADDLRAHLGEIPLTLFDDLIVVQTEDALLVANRHQADAIKNLGPILPDELL